MPRSRGTLPLHHRPAPVTCGAAGHLETATLALPRTCLAAGPDLTNVLACSSLVHVAVGWPAISIRR